MKSDHSTAQLRAIHDAALSKIKAEYSPGYAAIHVTAQRLLSVRESFLYRCKVMAQNLNYAREQLDQTGRLPNGCGETQGASQLESYNGQIHGLTETLNLLLSSHPLDISTSAT